MKINQKIRGFNIKKLFNKIGTKTITKYKKLIITY